MLFCEGMISKMIHMKTKIISSQGAWDLDVLPCDTSQSSCFQHGNKIETKQVALHD